MVNQLVFRWPTTFVFHGFGGSWYVIFTYIDPIKFNLNVGEYTIIPWIRHG